MSEVNDADAAGRKRRGFLSTNRRLAVTRQGKVFVGITLALGFGVLNSGNNLLFLCLGLLLSIITVSGILSESNVRDLKLSVRSEALTFVGEKTLIEFSVENGKVERDLYSLVIDVRFISKSRFRSQDAPVRLMQLATLMHVRMGEVKSVRAEIIFPERGEWVLDEAIVETEYPFGLFKKSRLYLPQIAIVVAPAPTRLLPSLRLPPTSQGAHTRQTPGHAIEPYDLREAAPGEDIRNVAWAKSATRGVLVSIRRASDATDAAVLALRGQAGELGFERALCEATGYLIDRMKSGEPTGLALGEATVAPATGIAHERAMLFLLAKAERGAGELSAQRQRAPIVWLG